MSPDFRQDINDNKEWSETDIADLNNHIAHGASLAETAQFLCRSGTSFEVAAKAKVRDAPRSGCLKRCMVGYHGLSSRSSSQRQSGTRSSTLQVGRPSVPAR
jgi:hypothetical protein